MIIRFCNAADKNAVIHTFIFIFFQIFVFVSDILCNFADEIIKV